MIDGRSLPLKEGLDVGLFISEQCQPQFNSHLKFVRKEQSYEDMASIHIGHACNLNNAVNSTSTADVEINKSLASSFPSLYSSVP